MVPMMSMVPFQSNTYISQLWMMNKRTLYICNACVYINATDEFRLCMLR